MKRYLQTFMLLILGLAAKSQTTSPSTGRLFIKDHITLSAGLMLREPWRDMGHPAFGQGAPRMASAWSPGVRLGATYTFNLGRRFGFETGFMPAVYWENLAFDYQDPAYPPYPFNTFNTVLELPLKAFYRFPVAKRLWIQPMLGVSFMAYGRKSDGFAEIILFSQDSTIYNSQAHFDISEQQSIFWNWHGGVAFSYQLPNEDLLRLGISTNLIMDGGNFWTGYGQYAIANGDGRPLGGGSMYNRGHMIAIDLGYTFSRSRELERDLRRLQGGE